jgi:hypothetical protein
MQNGQDIQTPTDDLEGITVQQLKFQWGTVPYAKDTNFCCLLLCDLST